MRLFIRDGGLGGGGGGESEGRLQAPTQKTKDAVDRHQNNKNVKAVSARHCAAASVPRSYCLNCCAEQSQKDNVHSSASEKQMRRKKSNSQVQLHSTSLLLISSGLT